MLINCKPGCARKKTTTTASLDVAIDEVVCDFCGEYLEVSSFVKNSMKQQGDIVRTENRKSFQFDCQTCNKNIETEVLGVKLKGVGCDKDCSFNVSKFTIHAMKQVGPKDSDNDNSEKPNGGKVIRRG